MKARRKKLGLIVNPFAGLGGRVGLKGSDGEETIRKAFSMGAEPIASRRGVEALKEIASTLPSIDLFTYPHEMGEDEAREAGFTPQVLGVITSNKTTAEDTEKAAEEMMKIGVDLLLFVGGDGTARDILNVINASMSVLGVPSGVKTYSAVFAVNPVATGRLVVKYLEGEAAVHEAEVLDIDEEAYRSERLAVRLYGYMITPLEPSLMQSSKSTSPTIEDEKSNQWAIARYIVEEMSPNTLYIVGPGTTTKPIADLLGVEKTLLGVDILTNRGVVLKDANEKAILQAIEGRKAKIVVTPIGRQGFIFGRGNQPISSEVIRRVSRENVIVVASHNKLSGLDSLHVDTGDKEVDELLRGYLRVVTDYREEVVVRCS